MADWQKPDSSKKSTLVFIRQFLAKPSEVASIIPSSPALVDQMLDGVSFKSMRTVVEYGPGTGAITERLLTVLPADTLYVAAEPNPVFRQHLKEIHPKIELIPDYAQNVSARVLSTHGEVDLVVSGLPCSIIPLHTLEQIFTGTRDMLRNGGEFRMFIYAHTLVLPKMHKILELLSNRFSQVQTRVVWRNMPPAMTVRCIK